MRRGGGDGRRFPKPSRAPSTASEATPALDASVIRNLDSAFSGRDSDAANLCSGCPASTASAAIGAAPNFSDRATQVATLHVVNGIIYALFLTLLLLAAVAASIAGAVKWREE